MRTNIERRKSQLDTTGVFIVQRKKFCETKFLVRVGVTSESVAELVRNILIEKDLTDISLVSMRDRSYGYPTRQIFKKYSRV